MPLSKEFYLDQIKSKYPNSYNKSLEDLPVKDLEDMLDFLDEALDKADGGAIGIEVLFKEKMKEGGRVGLFMGGDPLTGQALSIYNSMKDYGATDQAIADRLAALGLSNTPGGSTPPETTQPNIIGAQLNQGGDGFNPYNPDMSKINTTYQPNYDFRQFSEYGANPSTMDIKQMDMNQNYFNKPAPSGIQQAMLTAAGFIPGVGTAIKGAQFLGSALKGVMPVNQRAILENELRGSGVYTDDIGRIVGDPNTVGGVMAGYNANQMTDKTFDKRTDTIANTLSNKYGIDISSLTEEDIENFDPNKAGFDLVNRFGLITKAKTNFQKQQKKALEIAEFQKAEKERKKKEKEAEAARAAQYGKTNYGQGAGGQSYSNMGTQGFGVAAGGYGGPVSNRTGRGRTDYSKGGLATMFKKKR